MTPSPVSPHLWITFFGCGEVPAGLLSVAASVAGGDAKAGVETGAATKCHLTCPGLAHKLFAALERVAAASIAPVNGPGRCTYTLLYGRQALSREFTYPRVR